MDELRTTFSQTPQVYAPLLARELMVPTIGQPSKAPAHGAIGLIHLLGLKHGMPLAVELHVAATKEDVLVAQDLSETEAQWKREPQNKALASRYAELSNCHSRLTRIRADTIRELTILKSPVLVEYTMERLDLGSQAYLDSEYIEYYATVGAADALLRVLGDPRTFVGSSNWKSTLRHLGSIPLSPAQTAKLNTLLEKKKLPETRKGSRPS